MKGELVGTCYSTACSNSILFCPESKIVKKDSKAWD